MSGVKAVEEAENLGDEDVLNAAVWSTSDPQSDIYLSGFEEYKVYILGDTVAPEVEVFESTNSTNLFSACGESNVNGWDVMCSPIGSYRQIGAINLPDHMYECTACTVNVSGEGEVVVVDDSVLYADVMSGFMDVLAASFAGCCALCFGIIMLIIGACVAIFSNDGRSQTVIMAHSGPAFGAAPPVAPGAVQVGATPSPSAFAPVPVAGGTTLPPAQPEPIQPIQPAVQPTDKPTPFSYSDDT